jgi:hypothetical protein
MCRPGAFPLGAALDRPSAVLDPPVAPSGHDVPPKGCTAGATAPMGRPVLLVSTTREAWRHTPAAAWRVQVQFGTSNRSRGGRWGRTAASDFSRSRSETRATSSAALSVRVSPVRHLHDEHDELPIQDPVPHAVVPAPNPTAVLAPARRLYSLWPRVNGELPAGVGHGLPGPGVELLQLPQGGGVDGDAVRHGSPPIRESV